MAQFPVTERGVVVTLVVVPVPTVAARDSAGALRYGRLVFPSPASV